MKALIIGNVNADTVIEASRMPSPGENLTCQRLEFFMGGKAANQAVALSKLGESVSMISAVGDDEAGKNILKNLRNYGIECAGIQIIPNHISGQAFVIKSGGNNRILSFPGANYFLKMDKEKLRSMIAGADVVMLSLGLKCEVIEQAIEICTELGKTSAIDVTPINEAAALPKNLAACTIINCNETEALHLAKKLGKELSDPYDAGGYISKFTEIFILKAGANGASLFSKDNRRNFPVEPIGVVDVTGAGDAFFSALVKEYMVSKDISKAITFANKVGRLSCSRNGAQSSPTQAEVEKKTLQDAILIVGGGILQVPALKIAKDMGLFVICTDFNPKAPGFELCDEKVILSTKDVEGHVALAKKLAKEYNLKSVFTQGTDVEVTVASAACAVGLPSVSVEAAKNVNDKVRFRECLEKSGIENIKFGKAQSPEEAKGVIERIGLPVIMKALDNSGSRGAKKIISVEQITGAFEIASSFSSDKKTVLIEEWIDGFEQTVETIQYKGKSYRLGIADRMFGFLPYPVETGHLNPSQLDKKTQEKLYAITEKAAKAAGIDFGAAKTDTIVTKDGRVLIIEMTARLSGGFHAQYTTPYATGMNIIKAAMDISLGKDIDEADVTPSRKKVLLSASPFPPPGKITDIGDIEKVKLMPGVREVFMIAQVGEIVKGYENSTDRIAYVITEGDTFEETKMRSDAALKKLDIKTEK